jgi:cell division protein ZapA
VNVTINGRQFRMACEDGQEEHVQTLAKTLDERIEKLRGDFGEIGDSRLLVMAALTMADEAADATNRLRIQEQELALLQNARNSTADRSKVTQAALVATFVSAAERLEDIARKLNQASGDDKVALG